MPPRDRTGARMRDAATLARAELRVRRSVRGVMAAWLRRARDAVLAAAGLPDLNAWPPPQDWLRLVAQRLVPVLGDVFSDAARTVTPQAREADVTAWTRSYLRTVPDRLSARMWPAGVFAAVRAELGDAIAAGEGIGKIRDRIAALLDPELGDGWRWEAAAQRVARTEAVGAYNGGTQAAAAAAAAAGERLVKEWLATHDSRTRPSHAAADGQRRALEQPFTVGGWPLMFPGDPAGPASEVINCRCTQLILPEGD